MQPNARLDCLAELAVFDSAEADETFPADVKLDVDAGELSRRFDHQHAGKKRAAGDVAGDPELGVFDVLEAKDLALVRVGPDDAIELLHVPAMRVELAD